MNSIMLYVDHNPVLAAYIRQVIRVRRQLPCGLSDSVTISLPNLYSAESMVGRLSTNELVRLAQAAGVALPSLMYAGDPVFRLQLWCRANEAIAVPDGDGYCVMFGPPREFYRAPDSREPIVIRIEQARFAGIASGTLRYAPNALYLSPYARLELSEADDVRFLRLQRQQTFVGGLPGKWEGMRILELEETGSGLAVAFEEEFESAAAAQMRSVRSRQTEPA